MREEFVRGSQGYQIAVRRQAEFLRALDDHPISERIPIVAGKPSASCWNSKRLLMAIRIRMEFLWLSVGFPEPMGYPIVAKSSASDVSLRGTRSYRIDATAHRLSREEALDTDHWEEGLNEQEPLHAPLIVILISRPGLELIAAVFSLDRRPDVTTLTEPDERGIRTLEFRFTAF